jgi:ATP-dependent helicase HepA
MGVPMKPEVRCPICGVAMTLRTARFGPNAGNEFWGCSNYPNCKGLVNLDGSTPDRPTKRAAAKSKAPTKGPVAAVVVGTTRSSSRRAVRPGRTTSVRGGDLLVTDTNALGPGKLIEFDEDDLVLEYFDNPGQAPENRPRLSVPRRGSRRFALNRRLRSHRAGGGDTGVHRLRGRASQ